MNVADAVVYMLAENLGMTVSELLPKLSASEFFGWLMFYRERRETQTVNPAAPLDLAEAEPEDILRKFKL